MKGYSHAASGLLAGEAVAVALHMPVPQGFALAGYTAGMALLPDLDSCGSCAAASFGYASKALSHVIRAISGGHRHASHSDVGILAFLGLAWLGVTFRHDPAGWAGLGLLIVIAVAGALSALRIVRSHLLADVIGLAVAILVIYFSYDLGLLLLATALGALTHCVGDDLTDRGVMWFWPWKHKFYITPKFLRFTTGTWPEKILDVLFLGGFGLLAADAVTHGAVAHWIFAYIAGSA